MKVFFIAVVAIAIPSVHGQFGHHTVLSAGPCPDYPTCDYEIYHNVSPYGCEGYVKSSKMPPSPCSATIPCIIKLPSLPGECEHILSYQCSPISTCWDSNCYKSYKCWTSGKRTYKIEYCNCQKTVSSHNEKGI